MVHSHTLSKNLDVLMIQTIKIDRTTYGDFRLSVNMQHILTLMKMSTLHRTKD